jgi:hypothetical protein
LRAFTKTCNLFFCPFLLSRVKNKHGTRPDPKTPSPHITSITVMY